MSAKYIFGREVRPGEFPLPQNPTFHELQTLVDEGCILIPHNNPERPLGLPPPNATHFSRAGILIGKVARVAVNLETMGSELLQYARDPITDLTIRTYYEEIGARSEDIAHYYAQETNSLA
jgi:hypothetical protein